MKSKEEILRRIKNANSWRETGVTLNEAHEALLSVSSAFESEDVKVLKEKIKRLENANKQLREENKALRGGEEVKIILSSKKDNAINADRVSSFFVSQGITGKGSYKVFADEDCISEHQSEESAKKALSNLLSELVNCGSSILYQMEDTI